MVTSMAAWGCTTDTTPDERGGPEDADESPDNGADEVGIGADHTIFNAVSGAAGGCTARAGAVEASHIVMQVSWPASLAIEAGQGEMHLWTKVDLSFKGSGVTGTARACGTILPALTKKAFVGGGQVQVDIPGAVWDAPSMPVFAVRGTSAGFDVGAGLSMDPVASTLGITMSNPMSDPWPAQASQLVTVDSDGDGRPGIRAIPRTDPPFGAPPVDLAGVLDPKGPRADEVYLATRTVVKLTGSRDSCASAKGTAQVSSVDSHVVGCHVRGGGVCTAAQSDFIDAAQPKFQVLSATFEMVDVPAKATCADVRAILPVR